MENQNKIAKFAINANLDELQDIFDIEDAMDTIVGEFAYVDDMPLEVWESMTVIRDRLDRMRLRSMMAPVVIRRDTPESHVPVQETS